MTAGLPRREQGLRPVAVRAAGLREGSRGHTSRFQAHNAPASDMAPATARWRRSCRHALPAGANPDYQHHSRGASTSARPGLAATKLSLQPDRLRSGIAASGSEW